MVVWYFQSRVLRVGSTSFGVLRHLDAWIGCCAPSGAKLSLMSTRIHPSHSGVVRSELVATDLLWLKRHQSSDNALGFSSQDILMDLIHVWCSVLSLDLVWPRILSTSRNSMTKNDRNADFGVQDSRFHSFCP